jgi:23S rRNA (cytidine2498-2'-O)-methyltransferase
MMAPKSARADLGGEPVSTSPENAMADLTDLTGYLAAEGFVAELLHELGGAVRDVHGGLVLADGPERAAAWVANVWRDPVYIPISSIGDAAKKLRAIQRNWTQYPLAHHRRAALITDKLPKVSARPLIFGAPAPTAPLGSWTLIAPDMMLASPSCSSPFPNGEARFVEDKTAPSRAYLKLWELFTLIGTRPQPGELCLDLGCSPGGWTWVLQRLGARVLSVDKAALDASVAHLPGVEHRNQSAFALDPAAVGPVDWLFSDIVCYPKRLLGLVQKWRQAGTVRRFVCTIKFQGATDVEAIRHFAAIPGSQLLHLHHNKHELTWIRL